MKQRKKLWGLFYALYLQVIPSPNNFFGKNPMEENRMIFPHLFANNKTY
jgi:hypothetical protein